MIRNIFNFSERKRDCKVRLTEHIKKTALLYPDIWEWVNDFRTFQRGRDVPPWPRWCFLPTPGWFSIILLQQQVIFPKIEVETARFMQEGGRLAAIGTWYYTQGIYQFSPEFFSALLQTDPITSQIPSEIFYRLPEWCIYIETPNMKYLDSTLYGFWVHLAWDQEVNRADLRLLLDLPSTPLSIPFPIGPWSVRNSILRTVSETGRPVVRILFPDHDRRWEKTLESLLGLVLYLCSNNVEIQDAKRSGVKPHRSTEYPIPPDEPRLWAVGNNINSKLMNKINHKGQAHWQSFGAVPPKKRENFDLHWSLF